MIFRRLINAACSARLGCTTSRSVPSTRKTHARMPLVGLDVDVAGAVARAACVSRALSMRMMGASAALQQVFHGRQFLHHAREIGVGLDLADHRGRARFSWA